MRNIEDVLRRLLDDKAILKIDYFHDGRFYAKISTVRGDILGCRGKTIAEAIDLLEQDAASFERGDSH
jgi:hypothetical protein